MKLSLENSIFFSFLKPILKKNWMMFLLLVILVFSPFLEGYFYKQIIDSVSKNDVQIQDIFILVIIWGGVLGFTLLVLSVYRINVSKYAIDVEQEYVKAVYEKYWSLPIEYQISNSSGEFFAKLRSGQQSVWNIYSTLFIHILPSWLGLMVIFILSLFISPPMTCILFFLIPIQYLILNKGIKRNSKETSEMNIEFHKFFKLAQESIANVMMVKSFFRDNEIFKLIWDSFQKYSFLNKKVNVRWGKINMISHFISVFSRVIIFIFGAYMIAEGQITFGTFIMFLTFANLIFQPIQQLGEQLHKLQLSFASLKEIEAMVTLPAITFDNMPALKLSNLELNFSDVSFSYKRGAKVLQNISFTCKKNTITALVGYSGSGKSTIVNLINKFYRPDSGNILLDNQNLSIHSDHSVRQEIGVVFQENMMFNDTIKNNITLYKQDFNQADLEKVIELADLKYFIDKLPEKLETVVGEKGLKISGGEKQRIAIARALFKKPSVLILDEATSNLDNLSEARIQKVLNAAVKDRIVIVVAHRLSTIQNADQIIVIDRGEIANIGTHEQLLKQSPIYQALIKPQNILAGG